MLKGSVSRYFCTIMFQMKLPNSSLITKPKFIHTANEPLEIVSTDLSEASLYTVLRLSMVLQSSPSRDQLSQDFQNKLELFPLGEIC